MEVMAAGENIWGQQAVIRQPGAVRTTADNILNRLNPASANCFDSIINYFGMFPV